MHHAIRMRALALSAVLASALPTVTTTSWAAGAQGAVGFDYASGPGGEITRSALGVVGAGAGGASVAGGVLRFDNSVIGEGTGLLAMLGIPMGPLATLRLQGARYLGDEGYRAWRVRVGPELRTPMGASVGIFYSHYADEVLEASNGAVAEVQVPMTPQLVSRASASYMSSGGQASLAGSAGLALRPNRHLELFAEAGLAQSAAAGGGSFPSQQPRLIPLFQPGGSQTTDTEAFESTALFGLRVSFP